MLLITVMIIVAYLCGSLSGAFIVSELMHLRNPRDYGSHNPGATNMLRVNGKLPALFVLIFDMLKGLLPVYIAYRLTIPSFYLGIIAIVACLGHIFPCFYHFRGGKGVATALGSMMMIGFDFTGLFIATWITTVLITGYASVAAIISFLLAPLYVWFIRPEFTMPVAMLSCLVLIKHHSNMVRLSKGLEPKVVFPMKK
ncbi:glycerol-3-phosphate 1-O-acyltransferase PlsY [Frischella sp. Ac48]|nr:MULTISPECIES: glycerol-3-phosphate 1-O-acyltransferase PlsY [Frischella]MBX4133262.1 glycerol-3-phosphate 1-O-acyltransferase PlsY [Frischella sp. Ac48]